MKFSPPEKFEAKCHYKSYKNEWHGPFHLKEAGIEFYITNEKNYKERISIKKFPTRAAIVYFSYEIRFEKNGTVCMSDSDIVADWKEVFSFPKVLELPKTGAEYYLTCTVAWGCFSPIAACTLDQKINPSLELYFNNPEYSDFILEVEGEKFPVHKVMLAAQSSVFKAMFDTSMEESIKSRAEIKDTAVETMKITLKYIYQCETDELEDPEKAIKVFHVAHKYAIEGLQNLCTDYLHAAMEVKHLCKILHLAQEFELQDLKKHSFQFIKRNKDNLLLREDFQNINDPSLFIQFLKFLS